MRLFTCFAILICLKTIGFSSITEPTSKIFCKPDMTIDCGSFLASTLNYNFSSTWKSVEGKVNSALLPEIVGPYSIHQLEYQDVGSINSCSQGSFLRYYRVAGTSTSCSMRITITSTYNNPVLEWPIDIHQWNKSTLSEYEVLENTVRAKKTDSFGGCGTTGTNLIADGMNPTTNGYTPINGPLQAGLKDKPRFNPQYKNVGCNVFGRKVTIELYNVGEDCKKWLVKFSNINWCTYSDAGCRTTVYKYVNSRPAKIVSCTEALFKYSNSACLGEGVLRPKAVDSVGLGQDLFWSVRIFRNNPNPSLYASYIEYTTIGGDTNPNQSIQGLNPSIYFWGSRALPQGIHGVIYILRDGCGNVSECKSTITVQPKTPTPICIALSSSVSKNGTVEIWAKDFDFKSYANCGGTILYFTFDKQHPVISKLKSTHYFKGKGVEATDLEYSFGLAQVWKPKISIRYRPNMPNGDPDPRGPDTTLLGGTSGMIFGCGLGNVKINGDTKVKMTVWDESLASDFCEVNLTLYDNQGACDTSTTPPAKFEIGGQVILPSGHPLANASIGLDAFLPEFPLIGKTDTAGKFLFKNLPGAKDYTVRSNMPKSDFMVGVDIDDLWRMIRYRYNGVDYENDFQIIAADINGNGDLDEEDDNILVNKLLFNLPLPSGLISWVLVDKYHESKGYPFNKRKTFEHRNLSESKLKNDFIAIKVGDLVQPSNLNSTSLSQRSSRSITYDNIYLTSKETIELPFYFNTSQNENINGIYIRLKNRADILDIHSSHPKSIINKEDDVFKIFIPEVTSDLPLFTLTIRTNKNISTSDLIELDNLQQSTALIGDAIVDISLESRTKMNSSNFDLQAYPNPFTNTSILAFNSHKVGQGRITISDMTGKILFSENISVNNGYNSYELDRQRSNMAQAGVYFASVRCNDSSDIVKFIVLD
jgi:hypothetical protein